MIENICKSLNDMIVGMFLCLTLFNLFLNLDRKKNDHSFYFIAWLFFSAVFLYMMSLDSLFIYKNTHSAPFSKLIILYISVNYILLASFLLLRYCVGKYLGNIPFDIRKFPDFFQVAHLSTSIASVLFLNMQNVRVNIFMYINISIAFVVSIYYFGSLFYLVIKNKNFEIIIIFISFIAIITNILINMVIYQNNLDNFHLHYSVFGILAITFSFKMTVQLNTEYRKMMMTNENLESEIEIKKSSLHELKESMLILRQNELEYFSLLSDEIKSPFTLLFNYFENFVEKYGVNKEITLIKSLLNSIYNEIHTVIEYMSINKEKQVYRSDDLICLSQLLTSKMGDYSEYAVHFQKQLQFEIEDNISVRCSTNEILCVINNIFNFAIKTSPDAEIIKISLVSDDENILLKFEVDEPGKSEFFMEQISESYVNEKRFKPTGLRLGLYVAKTIIERAGGKITAYDTKHGTMVMAVNMPFSQCLSKHCSIENMKERIVTYDSDRVKDYITAEAETIMIVESNIQLLAFMANSFLNSYNVLSGRSASEAREKLINYSKPSLIILDMNLPDCSGADFFSYIRLNQELSGIPIICITADNCMEERVKFLKLGALDFIQKPFIMKELTAKVESILMYAREEKNILKQKLNTMLDEFLNKNTNANSENRHLIDFDLFNLSSREKEVAALLINGKSYKQIASDLTVSEKTVSTHIQRIYEKTKTNNKIDFLNKVAPVIKKALVR